MSWRGGGKGRWGHERTYEASQPLLSTTPSLINDMHTYSSFLAALKRHHHHQRGCAIVAFVKPLWPNTTTLPDKGAPSQEHTHVFLHQYQTKEIRHYEPLNNTALLPTLQQLQQLMHWNEQSCIEKVPPCYYRTSFLYSCFIHASVDSKLRKEEMDWKYEK